MSCSVHRGALCLKAREDREGVGGNLSHTHLLESSDSVSPPSPDLSIVRATDGVALAANELQVLFALSRGISLLCIFGIFYLFCFFFCRNNASYTSEQDCI